MDQALNRFVGLLKRNGIRISPAETVDALSALTIVTLDQRDTVRTVLRSTLIKDVHDLALFDALFELFFNVVEPRASVGDAGAHGRHHQDGQAGEHAPPDRILFSPEDPGAVNDGRHPQGEHASIRDVFDPDTMVRRSKLHQDPDQLALSALGQGLLVHRNRDVLDQATKKLSHQLQAKRVKNNAQPGDLNFTEVLDQLDEELIVNAAHALLDDLRDLEVDEATIERLAGTIDRIVTDLPDLLKRYVQREIGLQGGLPGDGSAPEPIRSANDFGFSESERRELEEIIRRLGRRMKGARSSRRVVSHRGRIHVARTLRQSMAFDAIPFRPVLTSQRNEKPRLVVICDVSLSVRHTARFMLQLAYGLQSLFEQVRSFVFVSELADATHYFEHLCIDDAIATVFGGELIDCDANSNYGRALEMFWERHLSCVTGQTTVIVLGDGRGNGNPPNVWALEEVRRRAKHVIWLSPESRGSWTLGGSDMPLYNQVCHRTEVVRNLTQLGEATERLFRSSAAAGGFGGR